MTSTRHQTLNPEDRVASKFRHFDVSWLSNAQRTIILNALVGSRRSSVGDLRLLIQRELPTTVGAVIGTRHRTNEGGRVGLAVCGAGVDQDGVVVVHLDETHIANVVCAPRWRFGERGKPPWLGLVFSAQNAAAPTLTSISWIRLPSASPGRCDDQAAKVSHLHPTSDASWST